MGSQKTSRGQVRLMNKTQRLPTTNICFASMAYCRQSRHALGLCGGSIRQSKTCMHAQANDVCEGFLSAKLFSLSIFLRPGSRLPAIMYTHVGASALLNGWMQRQTQFCTHPKPLGAGSSTRYSGGSFRLGRNFCWGPAAALKLRLRFCFSNTPSLFLATFWPPSDHSSLAHHEVCQHPLNSIPPSNTGAHALSNGPHRVDDVNGS